MEHNDQSLIYRQLLQYQLLMEIMQMQKNMKVHSSNNSPRQKFKLFGNKNFEETEKVRKVIPSASAHLDIKCNLEGMSSKLPLRTNKSLRKYCGLNPIFFQDEKKDDYFAKLRIATQPQIQDYNISIKNKINILPSINRFKTDIFESSPIISKCALKNNIVLDKMDKIIQILKEDPGTTINSTIETKKNYSKSFKLNDIFKKNLVTNEDSNMYTLKHKQKTIELRQILKKKAPQVLDIDIFKQEQPIINMKALNKDKQRLKQIKPKTQNRNRQKTIYNGWQNINKNEPNKQEELFTFYPKQKKNTKQKIQTEEA